jgi:uncharacterized membrane protein YcjF (UPF0283 family)
MDNNLKLKSLVRERQRFMQMFQCAHGDRQLTIWIMERSPKRRKTCLRLIHGHPVYNLLDSYLKIVNDRIKALTTIPDGADQAFDEFIAEMAGYMEETNGLPYWQNHQLYDKREVQRLYEAGYSAFQTFVRVWPINTKKHKNGKH